MSGYGHWEIVISDHCHGSVQVIINTVTVFCSDICLVRHFVTTMLATFKYVLFPEIHNHHAFNQWY